MALISIVVGSLSVINTMTMSVVERTREIGIKRAIGATRGVIMRELVWEAGFMGFIGGLCGLGLAGIIIYFANDAGQRSGTVLFLLTPWLGALGYLLNGVGGNGRGLACLERRQVGPGGRAAAGVGGVLCPFSKRGTSTRRTVGPEQLRARPPGRGR